MEAILSEDGVEIASFPPLFERGWRLAESGAVLRVELSELEARGLVQGGEPEPYEVAIGADKPMERVPTHDTQILEVRPMDVGA